MAWKTRYLANLMRLANAEGRDQTHDVLALMRIERQLSPLVKQNAESFERARSADAAGDLPHRGASDRESQAAELLAVALINGLVAEMEQQVIERLLRQSDLSDEALDRIRLAAQQQADALIQNVMSAPSRLV